MAELPSTDFAADPTAEEGSCLLRVVTGNFDADNHSRCSDNGHLNKVGAKGKGTGKLTKHWNELMSSPSPDVIVMSELVRQDVQKIFVDDYGYAMHAVGEMTTRGWRCEVAIFVRPELFVSSDKNHTRWVRVTVKVPGTGKQINIIGVHFAIKTTGGFPFPDLRDIAKTSETLILGDFNRRHPNTFLGFEDEATPGAPTMDRRTGLGTVDLRVSEAPLHEDKKRYRTDFVVQTNPSLNVCGEWVLHPCFSHYFSKVRLSVDAAAARVPLLAAVAGVAAVAAAAVQLRDGSGAAHVVAGVALAGAVAAAAAGQAAA
eukprot:Rhum_TRINITY_DN14027_c0_g3::Rhum_TRINITY_DN14027_c0_g3_i1::g.67945::m.67945